MVNPLDVPRGGTDGPLRDLLARLGTIEADLRSLRSAALAGVRAVEGIEPPPAPVVGYCNRRQSTSSNMALPNDTWTVLPWPVTVSTIGTAVSPAGNTLTANAAGIYLAAFHLHITGGGTEGPREARLVLNGVVSDVVSERAAGAVTLQVARPMRLAAGDALTVEAYQSSGSALEIWGAAGFSRFSLVYVGVEA